MSARLLSLTTVYATLSTCTFRQYIPVVSQAAALLTATDSSTGGNIFALIGKGAVKRASKIRG
ncbi:Uncharacterised protein [Serratia fonticola]|jgi:hypothetical protein|nr:Uncharacterised protein [Serratia fonticola]